MPQALANRLALLCKLQSAKGATSIQIPVDPVKQKSVASYDADVDKSAVEIAVGFSPAMLTSLSTYNRPEHEVMSGDTAIRWLNDLLGDQHEGANVMDKVSCAPACSSCASSDCVCFSVVGFPRIVRVDDGHSGHPRVEH